MTINNNVHPNYRIIRNIFTTYYCKKTTLILKNKHFTTYHCSQLINIHSHILSNFTLIYNLYGGVVVLPIAYKIKALREVNKMKQQDLADALFVSQQLVSSWECGKQIPDLYIVYDLAKLFNVTFNELLSNDPIIRDDMNNFSIEHELIPQLSDGDKEFINTMINFLVFQKNSKKK